MVGRRRRGPWTGHRGGLEHEAPVSIFSVGRSGLLGIAGAEGSSLALRGRRLPFELLHFGTMLPAPSPVPCLLPHRRRRAADHLLPAGLPYRDERMPHDRVQAGLRTALPG